LIINSRKVCLNRFERLTIDLLFIILEMHPSDDYDISTYQNFLLSDDFLESGSKALNNKVFMRDESGNLMWSIGYTSLHDKFAQFLRTALGTKSTIVARFFPYHKHYTVQIGYLRVNLTYLVKLKHFIQLIATKKNVSEKEMLKKIIFALRKSKEEKYSNLQNMKVTGDANMENADMDNAENGKESDMDAMSLPLTPTMLGDEIDFDIIRDIINNTDRYKWAQEFDIARRIRLQKFGIDEGMCSVQHDHNYSLQLKIRKMHMDIRKGMYTLISLFLQSLNGLVLN